MKGYFKYFKVPFIITLIILIISSLMYSGAAEGVDYERNNNAFDNSWCVFDYADKLTDEEEVSLNDLIAQWQYNACTDIVLITLDDAEYGYMDAVHELADWYAEEYEMGYYGPGTNAIVIVDNWSRGGDGKIHSWLAPKGDVSSRIMDSDAESILDILDEIENDDADPYEQYCKIIEESGKKALPVHRPYGFFVSMLAGVVAALIYIFIKWNSKLGDVEVTPNTYLKDGKATFPVSQDIFRNKVVTKRKIETSSSSSGGGSNGGGGHSR